MFVKPLFMFFFNMLVVITSPAAIGLLLAGKLCVFRCSDPRNDTFVERPGPSQSGAHDLSDFLRSVVGEFYSQRDARTQARICCQEILHLVGVSGKDRNEIFSIILQTG